MSDVQNPEDSGLTCRFMQEKEATRLLYMLPAETEGRAFAIQFLAAQDGEGTSSITRDFAVVASQVLGLKVLLLSIDGLAGSIGQTMQDRYGLAPGERLEDVTATCGGRLGLCQTRSARLVFAAPLEGAQMHLKDWVDFLAGQRAQWDLILIDAPALSRSYMGGVLSPYVDTNIIVIAAESTERSEVRSLMDRIEEMRGGLLGAVLNKRHFYIPGFLYKRL